MLICRRVHVMSRKLYLTNEDIHSYKHSMETLLICQSYFSLHINKYYQFGKQYFPLKTVLFMPGWIRSGHEGWGRGWMFHFSCAVNLLPIQTCQCNVAKVLVNCPNPIRLVGVMERYLPKSVKISNKFCYVLRDFWNLCTDVCKKEYDALIQCGGRKSVCVTLGHHNTQMLAVI